jgi:acyl-CoA reductase-like NAD-dependent aldehyde dehydrogenase
VTAVGSPTITTVDPTTGQLLEEYPCDHPGRVDSVLADAGDVFALWRMASVRARGAALRAIAGAMSEQSETLARLAVAEMGKTIREARAELAKCVLVCEYYAEHGSSFLEHEPVRTEADRSLVRYAPIGPVLGVMPWNYPFWQVLRFAAPALMAGNPVLLKHASSVTGCGLALAELFAAATGDRRLLQTLVLPGADVEVVIADPRVAAVTFTGSELVGSRVGAAAARAVKKAVLELGGSDPFVVAEDADIDAAVSGAVRARFQNCGQSYIAAKRFIAVEEVADRFEASFATAASRLRVGDPRAEETDMGPMARLDLRDELHALVKRGLDRGGSLIRGGVVPDGPGAFYPPTVVAGLGDGSPLLIEETFGPVAAIVRVPDLDHAIDAANNSPYGLSSSIWTADVDRAVDIAARIDAGSVFINAISASDPRMPFGGVKRSGYGRELGSFGIREFTNVQGVMVVCEPAANL